MGMGIDFWNLLRFKVAAILHFQVISTDTNPQPLDLLDIAAEMQGLSVTTMLLDIGCDPKGVPPHDVLIAADCMYNDQVARALARL